MAKLFAVKSFNGLPSEGVGGYVKKGSRIEVDGKRRAELEANGLVAEKMPEKVSWRNKTKSKDKKRKPHKNKMRGPASNKSDGGIKNPSRAAVTKSPLAGGQTG